MGVAIDDRVGPAVQVCLHGFDPLLSDALSRAVDVLDGCTVSAFRDVHLVRISLASIDEQIDVPTPWIAVLDVGSTAMARVARRAGASDVVTRDDGLEALRRSVRDVAAGKATTAPPVTSTHDALGSLSPRQVTVLALITRGDSNEGIADTLGISPNTARTHVQNVLSKLGVRNRLAAAAVGRAAGLGR